MESASPYTTKPVNIENETAKKNPRVKFPLIELISEVGPFINRSTIVLDLNLYPICCKKPYNDNVNDNVWTSG